MKTVTTEKQATFVVLKKNRNNIPLGTYQGIVVHNILFVHGEPMRTVARCSLFLDPDYVDVAADVNAGTIIFDERE